MSANIDVSHRVAGKNLFRKNSSDFHLSAERNNIDTKIIPRTYKHLGCTNLSKIWVVRGKLLNFSVEMSVVRKKEATQPIFLQVRDFKDK